MNARAEISRTARGLKYTVVATGSLAMTWAGSTHAQTTPTVDPRFSNAFDAWSLGAGAGINLFHAPLSTESIDTYATPSGNLHGAGGFASFEVGRDFQVNNAVFGIYGDFHIGEKSAQYSSTDIYSSSARLALGHGGAITGRAGVLTSPNSLLYGLFGWSWQHYTASVSGTTDSYSSIGASSSGVLNGPTVGIGGEMLFANNPNMSLKTEYRYTYFGNVPTLHAVSGSSAIDANFGPVHDHMLRFILTWKLPATSP
jgi:opacity protein-like surface antigen